MIRRQRRGYDWWAPLVDIRPHVPPRVIYGPPGLPNYCEWIIPVGGLE